MTSLAAGNNNATPPSPAVAPAIELPHVPGLARSTLPSAAERDPRAIAERLITGHAGRDGSAGIDPRVCQLVPGFDAPFFQAGLAGYSDAAMRIIARRHGAPCCVTEALLDITLLAGGRGFAKADLGDIEGNVPGGDEDHPLIGQIMGSDPATMAVAAIKMIEQGSRPAKAYRLMAQQGGAHHPTMPAGERSFATIDVNLACPVKKIARKARGGHWLAEPDGAIRILEAVREAVPAMIPVTVKMRRAFDETEEMRDAFFRIYDAAHDLGCAWVTVHGRTVRQKYVGPSRWDRLRDIVEHNRAIARRRDEPPRLIFGSGDVWHAADVFRMIDYAGVTGASIARGCIGNPWIFRQCRDILAGREPRPPTLAEQRGVLEQHFELALAVNTITARGDSDDARHHHAELHTARTMRKFGVQFAKHHPLGQLVKQRFIAVASLEDWRAVIDACYTPEGVERLAREAPVAAGPAAPDDDEAWSCD